MLKVGLEEAAAVKSVFESGRMFRYHEGGACARFEQRYADYIGIPHVALCSSGTTALTAALAGLEIGPGDEVLVPAHTYMATAISVLAVGAIPVIVDIDESITLDPAAAAAAIGPRTKAMIPVHMWGALANMDALMELAGRRGLLVIEDACQCVGGFYGKQAAGAIGHAGAYSFNYYKNITCGEGGAVVTRDARVFQRARCTIDPCSFYWEGRDAEFVPFVYSGARASEFEGAILNAQLDRLPGLIDSLRHIKRRAIAQTSDLGLTLSPRHSPDGECATTILYLLPTADAAQQFAETVGATILLNTGRHTYTEWDPILHHHGAHHPAMNPFHFDANRECRMDYRKDMCPASLDILARTVSVGLQPEMSDVDVTGLIQRIRDAAALTVGATAG